MNKNPPLLPVGLYDLLPPDAGRESASINRLLAVFSGFGYEQVSPPLMEFETSLLAGRGESLAQQTFRVLDPASNMMLGMRADMTLQIARIASSRLAGIPRPLRLCYAGTILQSRPESLRSERQLTQAGIELIGSDSLVADAEVMLIAAESLSALGVADITMDINLPGLIGRLCPEAHENPDLQVQIKDAVMRKSMEMISALPVANNKLLASLAESAGAADKALAVLKAFEIPEAQLLKDLTSRIHKHCPEVALTIDPLEFRGFEYHEGISFSIFAKGIRHELGRGGRYRVEGEPATGFTLYVTYLLPLLSAQEKPHYVLVPQDVVLPAIRDLQMQGMTTLYALTDDLHKEAKSLNITAIYSSKHGKVEKV